jgi:predicted SAM-dependent methyltransferase
MLKINLGCGTNRLPGWINHDADVDITQRLPWDDSAVSFLFAEHVVEHITYVQAIEFFRECHRVMQPNGVCRIAVPSVVQVWRRATPDYAKFAEKWVANDGSNYIRRSMTNILFRHGHQAPWDDRLLLATLFYAGFDIVRPALPGKSVHPELRGVEGHGKVIGNEFNEIETVVAEATK